MDRMVEVNSCNGVVHEAGQYSDEIKFKRIKHH